MSWDEFGILVGQGRDGIIRVGPGGGKPDRLITVKAGELAHRPQLLPDHETVLFTLAKEAGGTALWDHAQIVVQSLKTGQRTTLIEGGSDGRYLSSGHLVYALGGVLYAIPFDAQGLRTTGVPVPVVEGVRRTTATGTAQFSVADNGSLIYIPGPVSRSPNQLAIMRVETRTGKVNRLEVPPRAYETPRGSPNGKAIAMGELEDQQANIWVDDLTGARGPYRLTNGGKNRFPVNVDPLANHLVHDWQRRALVETRSFQPQNGRLMRNARFSRRPEHWRETRSPEIDIPFLVITTPAIKQLDRRSVPADSP
jgi:hypothetical protein